MEISKYIGQRQNTSTTDPQGQSNNNVPEFPFLRLPPEVRLQIYGYLIPNIDSLNSLIFSDSYGKKATKFRNDRTLCSPQLLRVNRQIHKEFMRKFYGNPWFEADVSTALAAADIHILGQTYWFSKDLPTHFFHIKHLKLCLRLTDATTVEESEQLTILYRKCFLERETELEAIFFEVIPDSPFWKKHLLQIELLPTTLKRFFEPLRAVRGLSEVIIREYIIPPHSADWPRSKSMSECAANRELIINGIESELRTLRKLMVLPRQIPSPSQV